MIFATRVVVVIVVGSVLTLPACGDDGNDRAAFDERAAAGAAESGQQLPAGTTVADPVAADGGGVEVAEGAGAPAPSTSPSVEPSGVVVPVVALDNSFRPEIVEIDVGDEVLWENRGINDHDVLYVDGDGWGIEVEDFGPGAVYAHVFTEPGEYRYYCSIHGNETVGMVGTVVVSG